LFCSNFHSLEALEACLEACPDVFCSNFHGFATLEFKTCVASSYIIFLWFAAISITANTFCVRDVASTRARRGLGEARRGLGEATPRTQNVLAQGQSEAYGDSKLYNTIVEVPARLNLSWCLCCLARILSRSWGRPQGKPRGFLVMEIAANQTI
jgi:hypothetical protein